MTLRVFEEPARPGVYCLHMSNQLHKVATFGNGCFWCTEALFTRLKGVTNVTSGYSGGKKNYASYELVSSGQTGHAEVIQLEYDPTIIPYERLVGVFFATHDPTTMTRQGNDLGEQYRSVIFYHDDEQHKIAESAIDQLNVDNTFDAPIVTQLVPFEKFFPAEDYHRDYYANNPSQPYCQFVISPKVAKLRKKFAKYLKEE